MSSVVVDTSVLISHYRSANHQLIELLESDNVLMHPLVVAEIACGTPPSRAETISSLKNLMQPNVATIEEVIDFIETNGLNDKGCGVIDMLLLASTLMTANAKIWTLDKSLAKLAESFGVLYRPKLH